jgi:starch phosphorylase
MQIIERINAQHLDGLRASGVSDGGLLSSLSVFDESGERRVRMGHLAFLGAHRVNGVSALHTGLMRETVFRDLHAVHPEKIVNKTNGISFRRWLFEANPPLLSLLLETIGPQVQDDPDALRGLLPLADDAGFRDAFARQRRTAKTALAALIAERTGTEVDPSALFDVHVKRIHEYKRQLLNVLQTVAAYLALRDAPDTDVVARVKIFSGKAAAG